MWLAPKAKHFELIAFYFLTNGFLNESFTLAIFFKFSKLQIFCMIWFFITFIQ